MVDFKKFQSLDADDSMSKEKAIKRVKTGLKANLVLWGVGVVLILFFVPVLYLAFHKSSGEYNPTQIPIMSSAELQTTPDPIQKGELVESDSRCGKK